MKALIYNLYCHVKYESVNSYIQVKGQQFFNERLKYVRHQADALQETNKSHQL